MKRDFCALSYSGKERICETLFEKNGPFWHLYTDGTRMQDIFLTEDDFDEAMWILAAAAATIIGVEIITFEIMGNHIHLILSGPKELCQKLFELFKARLKRAACKAGKSIDWEPFKASILPIESLRSLRNEIIYTNRNAFVANPKYTPFSYPWGGGCAYFNIWLKALNPSDLNTLGINRRRELTHARDISECSKLKYIGKRVFIPSFCNISLGESFFIDPRSYFNALTRNAEAYSQIAERLMDTVFLTDDELYSITLSHINKAYDVRNINLLSPRQKVECAKELKFKFNATKQQIRRLLKLDENIISELFG